jgi:acetylornithine deacetylase/succinyl-diaminopimelate desuccinylase-like protein
MRSKFLLLIAGLATAPLLAQADEAAAAARAAREWRVAHEQGILTEFSALLAMPNIASDSAAIRRNAEFIAAMFAKRGVATRLLEAPGSPPAVFGEIRTPGANEALVFYAHYDGQPLDPKEWATPPWTPVVRDGRMWARSAADDKAPMVAMAAALDALRAAGIGLRRNIRFFFEGEEEGGSPHLAAMLAAHKEVLEGAVAWLICDGPVHQTGRQQIVFGARGITALAITVYGPRRELHSGHYGNWAPNPAMMLAQLLASMKDAEGRVQIAGFYDGIEPLSDTEERAIAEAPPVEDALKRELWLGRAEGGGRSLLELLNEPSLNVRGMSASRSGDKASNVIPASATASIDIRLVKGVDPRTTAQRVIAHIEKQGYWVTQDEPDAQTRMAHPRVARVTGAGSGYRAVRTSMELPISRQILRAAESARGRVVKLPTMGGSVPLWAIEDVLHAVTIATPIANYDSNQHSFNENLRIGNLWDGIELMAALIATGPLHK